jgi:hypothetical protein
VLQNNELQLLKLGLSRNELSSTATGDMDTSIADQSLFSLFSKRLITTMEVCVSKIFPAGFGWQAGAGEFVCV